MASRISSEVKRMGCPPAGRITDYAVMSISPERKAERPQLFAHLVERGHAEVLGFEQLVGRALDQVAQGAEAEAVHALASAHRQVQLGHRLVQEGLFLLGQVVGRGEAALELAALLQRLTQA